MFSSGWILGIVFDIYRVLSRPLKLSRFSFSILDIIYWLLATLFVFRVLYSSNDGELRLYIFIALFFGTWFYYTYVSRYTVQLIHVVLKLLKMLTRFIQRLIQAVIIRPALLIYKILAYVVGCFIAIAIFFGKIVVQLCYPIILLIKWLAGVLIHRVKWPSLIVKCGRWIRRITQRFFGRKP